MSLDALWILFAAGFVVLALTLAWLWFKAFANLLWIVTLRPYIAVSALAVSVAVLVVLLDLLLRRQGLIATRFVVLLVLAPILTEVLANLIARWRAKIGPSWKDALARDFIFNAARQAQQDAFVASLAPPATVEAEPREPI